MPEQYQWIVNINPLSGIIECFRYGYLGAGHFEPYSLVYSAGFIVVLLFVGTIIFNKVEKSFMDTV
jgi:lipopolysaccharide transport system permease protein